MVVEAKGERVKEKGFEARWRSGGDQFEAFFWVSDARAGGGCGGGEEGV
jgi:hypothetical protein